MEKTSFSVLFYIRKTKLNRQGEAPITLRITVNGVRSEAYTHRFILPERWHAAKGRAIGKSASCRELNLYLDTVQSRIFGLRTAMEAEGACITADSVLNRYLGKDTPQRHSLLQLFREHNERCEKLKGKDFAPGTVDRYTTSYNHTLDFIRKTYHKDDVFLEEVDYTFLENYELYFKTVRNCCHNTAVKYIKNFKKIIRLAIKKGLLQKDPFVDIKYKLDKVEPDYLENTEIQALFQKPIAIPRLEEVRDCYLFSCFTGLAFSDAKQLKPEHLISDHNGRIWIRKHRQKTGNMCIIPLLDIARQIIEKYKDHPYCKATGYLLPIKSNQKMNAYLKEIMDICGIRKKITTHTARHTFATYAYNCGVSLESLAKMLGHSNTNMTRHYAHIMELTIFEEMKQIATSCTHLQLEQIQKVA